jgi:hypothetical protein
MKGSDDEWRVGVVLKEARVVRVGVGIVGKVVGM